MIEEISALLKIKINEGHILDEIMSIINSRKSAVLFLESTSSFWNQKTLYFSSELAKKGWKEKNMGHITKKRHHKRSLLKITLINSPLMRDLMKLEMPKQKNSILSGS